MSTMVKQLLAASAVALSAAALAQGYAPPAQPVAYAPSMAATLADWNRLRQSDGFAFGDYARFLNRHPGFPGEDAMRKTAERVIAADGAYPADVVAFFATRKPLTATGCSPPGSTARGSGPTPPSANR